MLYFVEPTREVVELSYSDNIPDRLSLVQLYLGSFMWMDLRVLLPLLRSRTKEYDRSTTNAKQAFHEE